MKEGIEETNQGRRRRKIEHEGDGQIGARERKTMTNGERRKEGSTRSWIPSRFFETRPTERLWFVRVYGCDPEIVKLTHPITTTNRLLSTPGTKPKKWWRRRSEYGGRIEAHLILGFQRFVGDFKHFPAELDFGLGMKIYSLTEIYSTATIVRDASIFMLRSCSADLRARASLSRVHIRTACLPWIEVGASPVVQVAIGNSDSYVTANSASFYVIVALERISLVHPVSNRAKSSLYQRLFSPTKSSYHSESTAWQPPDRQTRIFGLPYLGRRISQHSMLFVSFYAELGKLFDARKVLRKCETCVVAWNAMIDGFGKNEDMGYAVLLFESMLDMNVVSWTSVINGFGRNGCFSEGIRFFQMMMNHENMMGYFVKLNEAAYVSVPSSCANLGGWGSIY
ncbi:hypothetical protein ACFXTH_022225 [Malus domestica]